MEILPITVRLTPRRSRDSARRAKLSRAALVERLAECRSRQKPITNYQLPITNYQLPLPQLLTSKLRYLPKLNLG
ncbi:MAG TPA: hypothetical protein DDW76_11150 [Cyanobacteria bacterium UBA11369]|nr:hypothetical protein [Cyanobacteria bacterium UBA11371]HBE32169.1 hypothetical protein [Cyanobacteria bacterium UBA11368]HBE49327.1 hypothetical protein [Cyanobacteria bacterium UBA11369]